VTDVAGQRTFSYTGSMQLKDDTLPSSFYGDEGVVFAVKELILNEAESFATSGYSSYFSAGSAAARRMIFKTRNRAMTERYIGAFRGPRMDVFFKWQKCECREHSLFGLIRWSSYRWGEENEFQYQKCYFHKDKGLQDQMVMPFTDSKTLSEVTDEETTLCLQKAFAAFHKEVSE